MCVTDFTCFLLKIRFTLLCMFRCLQKVSSKITFLRSNFAAFLVVLGPFWLYEEFGDRYTKNPCQSLKKISVTIIIKAFITAYDSTVQDLAAKIHKKVATFRPKIRIL